MKISKYLNLGCGSDKREDYINLDIDKDVNPDVVANIEEGLPFKDNTFEKIISRHSLEHLHPDKLPFVLEEIKRVSKDKANIKIWCPHFSCGITYKNIGHLTPRSYFSFDNKGFLIKKRKLSFFRESFEYKKIDSISKTIIKIINPIFNFFINLSPLFYERFLCWIFPTEEVYFELEVKKC